MRPQSPIASLSIVVLALTLSTVSVTVYKIRRGDWLWGWQEASLTAIAHDQGYAYSARATATRSGADVRALGQVLEDGQPLLVSNAPPDEIRTHGRGRFTLETDYVYLSASDNSDPRSNGRRYSVRYPPIGRTAALMLHIITVSVVAFAVPVTIRLLNGLRESPSGARRLGFAIAAAYPIVGATYLVLRTIAFAGAQDTQFSDSPSFLTKAAESVFDVEYFIGSGRFFVVPIFYKMVSTFGSASISSFTIFQLVVSAFAWLVLAFTLAARFPGRVLGVVAFCATLLISLSSDVLMWDRMILSESISTSLFVLLVACWMRFAWGVTTAGTVCFVSLAGLWSFAREANSVLLLPFAAMLLCWLWWYLPGGSSERRRCAAAVAMLLVIVAATTFISRRGDRWVFPLLNVIGIRVLPSAERVAFYQARGMPVNERLLAMSGEFAGDQDWAFYRSPELESFRAWLMARGTDVYAEDLLSHPVRSLTEPLQDTHFYVCPDFWPYRPPGLVELLPQVGQAEFCGRSGSLAVVFASVLVGAGLVIFTARARPRMAAAKALGLLVAAANLLGWIPLVWLIWHAIGGMETSRHVFSGTIALRLATVITAVEVVDLILTRSARAAAATL